MSDVFDYPSSPVEFAWRRKDHASRIAYFVRNGWTDPIQIDVGIPDTQFSSDWIIEDGNHRLAAAFYMNACVLAAVSGPADAAWRLNLDEFLEPNAPVRS